MKLLEVHCVLHNIIGELVEKQILAIWDGEKKLSILLMLSDVSCLSFSCKTVNMMNETLGTLSKIHLLSSLLHYVGNCAFVVSLVFHINY